jgi:Asp-tRNA(Asn)/Glu-tRNA(Gln) amidotransferase A subunit family amidase
MDATQLNWLSAADAARAIRDGAVSSEQLVEACLARVREVDERVQAWAFLDPQHALEQARAADERRREGAPLGSLHGVPVGIKDIFDTGDMPTEDGTVLHAGRTPADDATAVARLRAAGAVIMGKTVTTELAYFSPAKTRNPHNPEHTPGGSSSGSAAAVGCGMVPLAIGSQTNGSVVRPAAYCGVYGFKPTHGLISRHGVLKLSRTLDHVGVLARSIEDIAIACEALVARDEHDPDTRLTARIPFPDIAAEEPPMPPRLAFVKTPMWGETEPETREAFEELVAHLGDRVQEFPLPESARDALEWHRTIMEAEMAFNLAAEYEKGRDRLSEQMRALLERGRSCSAFDYQAALARIPQLVEGLSHLFDHYDAILTPSAGGTAPLRSLQSTGSPMFCTLWTLTGMPALNLPIMEGGNKLPLGVQLVGPRHGDARLLRTARWLAAQVEGDADTIGGRP